MDNYEKSIEFVLEAESDVSTATPADPGGQTKYGIKKSDYPWLDIARLGIEEAKEIYYDDYWLAAGCDKLTWPLCLVQFDTAVNIGVDEANRIIGSLKCCPPSQRISMYLTIQRDYYKSIDATSRNGTIAHGWSNRLRRLTNYIKSHQGGHTCLTTKHG